MVPGIAAYTDTLYQESIQDKSDPMLGMLMQNVRNNLEKAFVAAKEAERLAFHVTNLAGFVKWKTDQWKSTWADDDAETGGGASSGKALQYAAPAPFKASGIFLPPPIPASSVCAYGATTTGGTTIVAGVLDLACRWREGSCSFEGDREREYRRRKRKRKEDVLKLHRSLRVSAKDTRLLDDHAPPWCSASFC
ncbi:unnamed protein product [Amoebophrya sp. A25]|nr:unnamed protein product [Amoebophrya sp. A25]|eukprot:GSA25T00016951001.1